MRPAVESPRSDAALLRVVLVAEVRLIQAVVIFLKCHQLRVRTAFQYATSIDVQDGVGVNNGRQAVSDDY